MLNWKTIFPGASHGLAASFLRISRDATGAAVLETALVSPVILLLALGGTEIVSNLAVRKEVNEVARMVADNASRISEGSAIGPSVVRESDINDILFGAALQGETLDLFNKGKIVLSSLEQNADGGQWVHWQRCFGLAGYNSPYVAGMGQSGKGFPGLEIGDQVITAAPNDAVMYVEVVYYYEPIISVEWAGYSQQRIRAKHAMNVRDRRNLTGIAPDQPESSCN